MMLTASPFYTPHSHNRFMPSRSSPLSERNANTVSQAPFMFTMASPIDKKPTSQQRAYKSNPVMQTRDQATARRREMFFRRVKNEREEKKWDSRVEQLERLDFMSEQKRWEAEKARQARHMGEENLDDELFDEIASSSYSQRDASQPQQELEEADYIQQQEEEQLQQLIALMEEEENQQVVASQHFGSDDEDYDQDYDQIFMECAMTSGHAQQSSYMDANFDDMDAMDTT
ncbi:hypothetical protein EJ04DRAFT_454865 [Polyplosphaeria fusca]|uniref:Uncharacterized protein n=1 Tax=Polyplosphaeria fusca TaxID=682080 RepID=A0A9P4RB09_9PLEO|nr:hypothetical protein EJ04DRAFT_454865 [Polyplosphaeria fusca]